MFDTPNGKISIDKAVKMGSEQAAEFPPLKVVNVKGQLVARDGNSRLFIVKQTKTSKIKVELETDVDIYGILTVGSRKTGCLIRVLTNYQEENRVKDVLF